MAPSPIIPTSFVPKQPVRATVNRPRTGTSLFSIVAFGLLVLSIVSSGAVFAYEGYLRGVRDADVAALETAKQEITGNVVQDFIRTRDRLSAAKSILDGHVAFSNVLDKIESVTLKNVRFISMSFVNDGMKSTLQMSGSARTFNTLAAQATAMAGVKELHRAIFSGIAVDPATGIVRFNLSAEIDPSLLIAGLPAAEAVQVASSTPGNASSTPAAAGTKAASTTP